MIIIDMMFKAFPLESLKKSQRLCQVDTPFTKSPLGVSFEKCKPNEQSTSLNFH